jgi:hypothetical protein
MTALFKETKMNRTHKLAALSLLIFSQGLLAAGPVPLNTAELDRITAGTHPFLDNIVAMIAVATDAGRLHLDQALSLRIREALLSAVPGTAQAVSFQQSNGSLEVVTNQSKLADLSSFRQLFGAIDPLFVEQHKAAGNTLTPGVPVWIRQVNAQGTSYTYVDNFNNYSLKLR